MPMERTLDLRNDQDLETLQRRAPADAAHDASPPDLGGAVVQQKADGSTGQIALTGEREIQAAAHEGIQGGGAAMPHLDAIQQSFGPAHDLSGIRAHVGGDAASASEKMGAEGFATGNDVAFQRAPDLHLAAHEAAHVVQRQGVAMKGGVGRQGDAYEQHADAVADRVVAGQSASDLLPAAGSSGGDTALQFFLEKEIAHKPCRVSEDNSAAVMGESGYSQDLYATAELMAEANTALAASGDKGSYLRLANAGGNLKLGDKTLLHLRPVFSAQGDANNKDLETANQGKDAKDKMSLWADCGRSSRAVMGSHADAQPHAVYTDGGKEKSTADSYNPATYSDTIYRDAMPEFLASAEAKPYLKDGVHFTGDASSLIAARSADHAREQYWELGEDGRRLFDQKVGINTGANPDVGGGYTMNTEYNMPGFKENARNTWNFHWAGCVMKAGSDNITLENYADGNGYESVNMDWNFQMYGTVKKGQSFQEEHLASNTHGSRASSFAVKPDGD